MAEEKVKQNQNSTQDFLEKVLEVRRVAKVITGGRRFAFSALVVVGDKQGRVGFALGKSREVASAIAKAVRRAKDSMIEVPRYKTTIPFMVIGRHGASKVILRPAALGAGVIAGGAVRSTLEALGIRDILAKSLGSGNPQNVVKATIDALSQLRSAKALAALRGKTIKEIVGGSHATTK